MQSGAQTTMEATLMSQQTPAQREKVLLHSTPPYMPSLVILPVQQVLGDFVVLGFMVGAIVFTHAMLSRHRQNLTGGRA